MMGRFRWTVLAVPIVLAVACASSADSAPVSSTADAAVDEAPEADAGSVVADAGLVSNEAGADAARDLGKCASAFGDQLTAAFGRIDGKLIAIVEPGTQTCAMPNSDHLVAQIEMKGAVYRIVVNVESDRGTDRAVRFRTLETSLGAPAWEEGWHTGLALDYVALGAHSDASFEKLARADLVKRIIAELEVSADISAYATAGAGRPESAHLVHRQDGKADGALVVDPKGNARYLLFHFADQTF